MSKIRRTADDIAFQLGSHPVAVIAPLPERAGLIGVEVPSERRIVRLGDLPTAEAPLTFPLGFNVDGDPIFMDLAAAPHLLVAGETGSGKSSMINAMLCSLLSRFGLDELALVMIDPKQVELTPYDGVAHLLAPVADTVETALARLTSCVKLMDLRYNVAQTLGVRSLAELNMKMEESGDAPYPYVVVVVDELADLMMTSKKECESLIVRLAQKARAVGIHLVLATQAPQVAVCSGVVKANLPSRLCFSVSSMSDSRVVLDRNGAEKLLGRGDGLVSMNGARPVRFQGAYIDSDEIKSICDRWR
jgi:S-DNA-T family DNA segregation ATPase FtsK/SpoIIIE